MVTKLVIDTDGVCDDVRAISLALQRPDVQVLALTAVNGCVTVHQACANLARTLRANQKHVPIYMGAEFPLLGNGHSHVDEQGFFGEDGLGDAPADFPRVLDEDFAAHEKGKHAAQALCELFQEHSDATLVCIGPLTNVALALKLSPAFARAPARLVVLGGNVHGMGNVHSRSTAEFNFSCDPEAAHIVLKEMHCPITVVPWEAFINESSQSAVDFHAHLDIDVPLARFFATAVRIPRETLEKNGRQYAYCDEIAVAVAIDPEAIVRESKMLRASVELHGEYTRGQVAVDWVEQIIPNVQSHPKLNKSRRPIEFVFGYDVQLLDDMVRKAIHCSAVERRRPNGLGAQRIHPEKRR